MHKHLIPLCCVLSAIFVPPVEAAPSDAARQQLDALITNVKGATMHRYDAHDSVGSGMDTLKIIADPSGGYLGVYHTYLNSRFVVSLATSTDLMNWTFRCQIAAYAADPDLYACANGGFVMAWEQTNSAGGKNHLHFAYYANRGALLAGTAAQSFDAAMTLSKYAEGTPSIYAVTMTNGDINTSTIDVGGHYNDNTLRLDRQQRGTLTNFNSWTTAVRRDYDNAILYYGAKGNIGDRDPLTYDGYQFNVMEGQSTAKDFGSWKVYNYDFQTGNADQLSLTTDGGSTSFGNPTMTSLIGPDGNRCLVGTAFIFSQNSAPGEAGSLIYYTTLPAAPAISNGPPSTTTPLGTAYSFAYKYTGFPAPTFTVVSGALPPGLTLSSAGLVSGNPSQAGIYRGTVQASNGQGAAARQPFEIVVTQTYDQWASTYFPGANPAVSAPDAVPQNDQTPNLLKYAVGIDPTLPLVGAARDALPVAGLDGTTNPSIVYLTLTYRKSAAAFGINTDVQVSSDLQAWTTVDPSFVQTVRLDSATGDPVVRLEVDSQKAAREFIRLKVTLNQ